MKLTTNTLGITTRNDGLPYDVIKVENGYQFRAIGNPAKPVVIATTKTNTEAIMMLVAQAPEDEAQLRKNEITKLLASKWITESEKNVLRAKLGA
jgi:hypothetical protein